jgi:hypothetical protein
VVSALSCYGREPLGTPMLSPVICAALAKAFLYVGWFPDDSDDQNESYVMEEPPPDGPPVPPGPGGAVDEGTIGVDPGENGLPKWRADPFGDRSGVRG